jgi:hypothetical protein
MLCAMARMARHAALSDYMFFAVLCYLVFFKKNRKADRGKTVSQSASHHEITEFPIQPGRTVL